MCCKTLNDNYLRVCREPNETLFQRVKTPGEWRMQIVRAACGRVGDFYRHRNAAKAYNFAPPAATRRASIERRLRFAEVSRRLLSTIRDASPRGDVRFDFSWRFP
jgi:hypothetical protein